MSDQFYWMSFADPDRPEGTQFLGCLILQATDPMDLITKSHRMGLNPGGEVQFLEIPPEGIPAEKWHNRLLSRDDVAAIDTEQAPQ
jgi:hypothetical protein